MKEPGHSGWEKLKEVSIEVFIIVFAVTLSIGLHNWSEHRNEQYETREFLQGQNVLVYYQQIIPNLNDAETIVNSFQMNILNREMDRNDNISLLAVAKTFKMRAFLKLGSENMDGEIKAYDDAQQQAKKIIALINQQSQ
jgi:hypothetical protein